MGDGEVTPAEAAPADPAVDDAAAAVLVQPADDETGAGVHPLLVALVLVVTAAVVAVLLVAAGHLIAL